MLRRLGRDRSAAVNIIYVLLLPACALLAAGGLNLGNVYSERVNLQSIADETALAAARELGLSRAGSRAPADFALRLVDERIGGRVAHKAGAEILDGQTGIRVTVTAQVPPALAVPGMSEPWEVAVSATARMTPGPPLCVVVLDPTADQALALQDSSKLSARKCAVVSNSTASRGLSVVARAQLLSTFACSAGGFEGPPGNFRPTPVSDCPSVEDPLEHRAPPPVSSGCNETDKVVGLGVAILKPGTYCGGLKIRSGGVVTLLPGTYVMKDGPLEVDDLGIMIGLGVGFYLKGDTATIHFAPLSTISLTAPKQGAMAGFLMFEDRASAPLREHRISSNTAKILLGTIYLSRGRLVIDTRLQLAQESAYTIIVARRLELHYTADLVLNAAYNDTDVPVPTGVGPTSGPVRLAD